MDADERRLGDRIRNVRDPGELCASEAGAKDHQRKAREDDGLEKGRAVERGIEPRRLGNGRVLADPRFAAMPSRPTPVAMNIA